MGVFVSCDGKQSYNSRASALEAITRIVKRKRRRRSAKTDRKLNLEAYRCARCHDWHVGSSRE